MSWDPKTHPYVVHRFRQSSQPGCFGWACDNASYTTEAEARAAHDKLMGRGGIKSQLYFAGDHPKWVLLAERRNKGARK